MHLCVSSGGPAHWQVCGQHHAELVPTSLRVGPDITPSWKDPLCVYLGQQMSKSTQSNISCARYGAVARETVTPWSPPPGRWASRSK